MLAGSPPTEIDPKRLWRFTGGLRGSRPPTQGRHSDGRPRSAAKSREAFQSERVGNILRLVMFANRLLSQLVLAPQARVAMKSTASVEAGGGSRSMLGHAGHAQGLESAFNLDQIRRVLAHRSPGSANAGDGVDRVERETGLDSGMRLVKSNRAARERRPNQNLQTENFDWPRLTVGTT